MLGEYSGESNDAESQKDSELSVGNFGPVNAHEEPSHSTSESHVSESVENEEKFGQSASEADKPENPLNNNTNEKYDSRGRKRQADCPKNGKNPIFGQSGVIDIAPNGQNIYKKAKIRKSPRNKKKRTEGDRIGIGASPGHNSDEMSQGASKK